MAGRPVTTIRNLGARMAEAFARVGITTAEELEAMGADAAYARLLASGHRPHILAFQAVALGLEGRHWNSAEAPEKAALRARFDALRAGASRSPTARDGTVEQRTPTERMGAQPEEAPDAEPKVASHPPDASLKAVLESLGLPHPSRRDCTGRRRR